MIENNDNAVECPICHQLFRQLAPHLRNQHDMSADEFRLKFPALPLTCKNAHILSNTKRHLSFVQNRLYQYLRALSPEFVSEYFVNGYYLDIAHKASKLDIEVDGIWHQDTESEKGKRVQRFDALKTIALEANGWRVLRFTLEEIVFKPFSVLMAIAVKCKDDSLINLIPEDVTLFPEKATVSKEKGSDFSLNTFCNVKSHAYEASEQGSTEETYKCTYCKRYGAAFEYHKHHFCDEECRDKYYVENGAKTSICPNCGKTVYYLTYNDTTLFCDDKCQEECKTKKPEVYKAVRGDLSRNSEYNKKRRKEGRVSFKCATCGKESWTHARSLRKSESGNLFCCKECYWAYRNGLKTKRVYK